MERFQLKGAPTCRIVYPQGLFEKRVPKGATGDPKYSATILVPKDDAAKVQQLMDNFNLAFQELQKSGFKGKTPNAINPKSNCLWDGDKLADEEDGKEAFRGYYLVKVGSKNFRPIITDKRKLTILNGVPISGLGVEQTSDETLEDGDYILCNISFWTYNNASAQGIGANVHAIVRMAPGERISGVSTNVEDYIDIDEEYL